MIYSMVFYSRPDDLINNLLQQGHVFAKLHLSFYNRLSYQRKDISFCFEILLVFSDFLIHLSLSATREATRLYQFVTNNDVSKNLLIHQKASKYFEHDCRWRWNLRIKVLQIITFIHSSVCNYHFYSSLYTLAHTLFSTLIRFHQYKVTSYGRQLPSCDW